MKLISVLRKDLLILLRSRAEMMVLFLMPLAFIIPISLALGSGDGYGINRNNRMIQLPVVDYDRGPRAQVLQGAIGEGLRLEKDIDASLLNTLNLTGDPDCALPDPKKPADNPVCIEKAGRAMLQRSWRPALLIIPEGFSSDVDAGKPVKVTLLYDPAGDSIQMQQVEGVVKGATIKVSLQNQMSNGLQQLNDLVAMAPKDLQQSVKQNTTLSMTSQQNPALSIQKVPPQSAQYRPTPDTYQQTIPGYSVMYVFFIITSLTSSIRQERLQGTFRRMLSAPVSRAELLGGKILATMVVGLAQVLILFGVGALVFKLGLGSDPLAFFLLTVALVAAAAAIGLAASTAPSLKGGALTTILIISALLGGCMFPLDLMPGFLRSLSYLFPHSWALSGYQNLMVRGQGLQEVLPQILVLLGFAALFFLIAVRRFNFEHQEAA